MVKNNGQTILVVNDIEATRKSIKILLTQDGYHIKTARNERQAAKSARFKSPDLMLVSLEGKTDEIVAGIRRICEQSALTENVPVIIFCAGDSPKTDEVNIERNIYFTCPDNFNNLRSFISHLLEKSQEPCQISAEK